MVKLKLRSDNSVIEFTKAISKEQILIGETIEVSLHIRSLRRNGLLDFVISDDIPDQFQLVGDIPQMRGQLDPGERRRFRYQIMPQMGGYYETTALCELENKFTLDDIPSNQVCVYVSPLDVEMGPVEMTQGQWKPLNFTVHNMGKEDITSIVIGSHAGMFEIQSDNYDSIIASGKTGILQINAKTNESGSVNLDLEIICTDNVDQRYKIERSFLIDVTEVVKDHTNVNIGSIGEIVSTGATQIKDSLVHKTKIGGSSSFDDMANSDPALVGSTESSQAPITPDDHNGGNKFCPNCGKSVEAGWKVCPYCETRICQFCGKKVDPDWVACPACGNRLTDSE